MSAGPLLYISLWYISLSLFRPLEDFLLDGLEDDEEAGHDEQQGNGADEHAADGAHAERMVAVARNVCSVIQAIFAIRLKSWSLATKCLTNVIWP